MTAAQPAKPSAADLARGVEAGERGAVARALNLLDDSRGPAREKARRLLASLSDPLSRGSSHLIGLTGPPGAGKSSLTSALIRVWRRRGLSVGILAVDPSSPISGGALLGDRLRMMSGGVDEHVFIRSLACRGAYGGLSAEVWPMSLVMLAAFDLVLVETVGVGQREIDVSKMTDTTCFVAQPASGDSIQFLKAGIMEVPHVLVVNKADMGAVARRTLSDLRASLRRRNGSRAWQVPALSVSAAVDTGIDELADTLARHHRWLEDHDLLRAGRRRIQAQWILKRLGDELGRFGIDRLGGEEQIEAELIQSKGSLLEQYDNLQSRFFADLNISSPPSQGAHA